MNIMPKSCKSFGVQDKNKEERVMCKNIRAVKWAGLLSLIAFAVVNQLLAHQDPPPGPGLPNGCAGTGGSISLTPKYADGFTDADANSPLFPCETIVYIGNIGHAIQATKCNPQGGTVTITTPDGVVHDVTPPGGIPEFGPGQNLDTLPVSYTVRPQDISSSNTISALIHWVAERSHTRDPDTLGQPDLSTGVPNIVTNCPPPGACETIVCDPNAIFATNALGGFRKGTCVRTALTPQTCSINPASATLCTGLSTNFTVTITPNQGTAPFTISWTKNGAAFDGGDTTITAVAPAPGVTDTYIAQTVSANHCTNTCKATLTGSPALTCDVSPPSATLCTGLSTNFTVNIHGGTAPFTISWTKNGAAFNGSSATITVVAPAPGVTDTYIAHILDSAGCTTDCPATLTGSPALTCDVSPP